MLKFECIGFSITRRCERCSFRQQRSELIAGHTHVRTVGFLNTEFLRLNAIGLHEMSGLADLRRKFFDALDNIGNEADVVEGKGAVRREHARCARRGDEKRKTFLHILCYKADLRACALCRVDPIEGDGIERCQLIKRRGRDRTNVCLETGI